MFLLRKLKKVFSFRILLLVFTLLIGFDIWNSIRLYDVNDIKATVASEKKVSMEIRGSRSHYRIIEVDEFVWRFLDRYSNNGSSIRFESEETYDNFRKRLNSLKKSGIMLHPDTPGTAMNTNERFCRGINQFYMYNPDDNSVIPELMKDLSTLAIVSADILKHGSQLKLLFKFGDGSFGRFKPKRRPADEETHPNIFFADDFERHTAEIGGFHLDRVLGFHRAVPVVGRALNITRDLASLFSNNTDVEYVFRSPVGNLCFVAKCLQYCGPDHPICGRGDILEGAISPELPYDKLHKWVVKNYPYARLYLINKKAAWEKDEGFCEAHVKKNLTSHILLELTDLSVFDYMIDNKDRHYYLLFRDLGPDSFVPVYDSGRGFGKSSSDCQSILAPLTQCCMIRLSTLATLIKLYQGPDSLSQVMRTSLNSDPLSPVLHQAQLNALDRRVGKVIKAVSDCINKAKTWEDVVVDDITGSRK